MTKENVEQDITKLLGILQCQYLCCYPVNCIAWQDIPTDISWNQQQQLIANTYGHTLNQQYPVKIAYQLNFLKRLLQHLEQNSTEIHDDIYKAYCQLQKHVAQETTQKYAYKHYMLPVQNTALTLRESKSFVAEGTTGLCSWQASLALADYLLHNLEVVQNKNILELGAGTGLCGFILTRCCGASQVLLTDGSAECVELMHENIKRNFAEAQETADGCFKLQQQILSSCQLPWNTIEKANLEAKIKPDMVLAADVVYDDDVFDELTNAIDFVFKLMKNQTQMLLAATVRNEHTLQKFTKLLENLQFCLEEQHVTPLADSYLFWDRTTPIKIFKITRT